MNAPIPGEILHRPRLMTLLHTGLNLGETRFVRRLALSWLASFPGDLPVRLIHSRALLTEGHPQQAIDILEEVTQVDVEYLEAYQILEQAQEMTERQINPDLFGILYLFTGQAVNGIIPEWAKKLRGARQALSVAC